MTFSNASCDGCYSVIIGSRVMCLECTSKNYKDEINLCVGCMDTSTTKRGFIHDPSHDLVKLARIVHDREKSTLNRRGKEVLDHAHALFKKSQSGDNEADASSQGDEARSPVVNAKPPGVDVESQEVDADSGEEESSSSNTIKSGVCCSCCNTPVTGQWWFCTHCGMDFSILYIVKMAHTYTFLSFSVRHHHLRRMR